VDAFASSIVFQQDHVLAPSAEPRRHLRPVPALQQHCVLTQPDAGAAPILRALQSARRQVRIKMFKLTSEPVLREVVRASRRGVDVQVMLNPSRSDGSRANDEAFGYLQQAGVAVRWTSPDFYVTHEKSMVVDDLAFICTFNFADKYFEKARGYAIVTRDAAEVAEVVEGFAADWQRRPFQPQRLVWSQAGKGNSRQRMQELIEGAQHELAIQNPKLVDAGILAGLCAALQRGVRVRFLSSGMKGLSPCDVEENGAAVRTLAALGAQTHAIKKPKVHAKLVVADRSRALVGSMNLDRSCFELRRELGIYLDHPVPVAELLSTFERDWKQSKFFRP
jgi:cardiolipin synthase A/B